MKCSVAFLFKVFNAKSIDKSTLAGLINWLITNIPKSILNVVLTVANNSLKVLKSALKVKSILLSALILLVWIWLRSVEKLIIPVISPTPSPIGARSKVIPYVTAALPVRIFIVSKDKSVVKLILPAAFNIFKISKVFYDTWLTLDCHVTKLSRSPL